MKLFILIIIFITGVTTVFFYGPLKTQNTKNTKGSKVPPSKVSSNVLIVSYGIHNSKPYAFIKDGELVGGVIKDIMDELGKALNLKIKYRQIPRKRLANFLISGELHVLVLSNPKWFKESADFYWSEPLIEETNRIVVSANRPFEVNNYDDLKGKRVGTLLGYQYPGLMELFEQKTILRIDAKKMSQSFKMLDANRIDSFINSNILMQYYMKRNKIKERYIITNKIASSHFLRSAYSKKSPVTIDQINKVYRKLKKSGKIKKILSKYQ